MSIRKHEKKPGVGLRLGQERKRLGYSQAALMAEMGMAAETQISYEADSTRPDAAYFAELNKLGADIFYIITGLQLEALKEDDERRLLANYRLLDPLHKPIVLNLIEALVQSDEVIKKNAAEKKVRRPKK